MLSNIRAEKDPIKYKSFLKTNFLLVPGPAIALALPVIICSHLILRVYGPAFQHGRSALILIAVAAVLTAVNMPVVTHFGP